MKFKPVRVLWLIANFCLLGLVANSAQVACPPRVGGFPDCSEDHCSRISQDKGVNIWCVSAGFSGCPMIHTEETRSCFCLCSCVAGDTLVHLANGKTVAAQELREGDEIASPFGNQISSKVLALTASDATGFPALKLFFDNGNHIVVSKNHVFLGPDGNYYSADALKVGDKLASHTNKSVAVSQIEVIRSFEGLLYNVIINDSSKERKDHLLVTNDVISGDFILQNEVDHEISVSRKE